MFGDFLLNAYGRTSFVAQFYDERVLGAASQRGAAR